MTLFKSYYVVWKPMSDSPAPAASVSLNRTM